MKKLISCLVLTSLLLQIGCSSITQIPYPADQRKSDDEIRQLNYFGERLSSTIHLTNSAGIEAYWLKMKDDRIYFLTEGLNDTTSVNIEKVKSVKFYDAYGGCMKGGWLGVGISLAAGILISDFGPKGGHPEGAGYGALVIGAAAMILGTTYGIFFLGQREFNFVRIESVKE